MFQTKVVWIERRGKKVPPIWVSSLKSGQGHINFLNGSPYFSESNSR